MALGARPRDIAGVMSRRALTLVVTGLGLGLVSAFAFNQIAAALLYGVTASDAATFASMSALLAVVTLVAIYVPARAATRLDVLGAIRYE